MRKCQWFPKQAACLVGREKCNTVHVGANISYNQLDRRRATIATICRSRRQAEFIIHRDLLTGFDVLDRLCHT